MHRNHRANLHPHQLKKMVNGFCLIQLPQGCIKKADLGLLTQNGVLMNPVEVMFCHWNRHIPVTENWVSERISEDEDFIAKSVVFDVARSGGEIVIPSDNLATDKFVNGTFAVKWSRNKSHFNSESLSQIRWFWASENVDSTELITWVNAVLASEDLLRYLSLMMKWI